MPWTLGSHEGYPRPIQFGQRTCPRSPRHPPTLGYDSATGLGYGIAAAKGITGGRRATREPFWKGNRSTFHRAVARESACRKGRQTSILSAVDLAHLLRACGSPIARSYRPDGISQVAALKGNGIRNGPSHFIGKWERLGPHEEARSLGVLCRGSMQWKLVANNDLSFRAF